MALKKSQLYSSLWQSCDELRGGMDASQYKDYVLTLLFMKYVSDKYTGKADAVIEVPAGGSFADMVKLKGDTAIGEKINIIIAKFAKANDLEGVIDQADFNDEAKLGKGKEMQDRLSKLVAIFDSLDFRANRAEGDDLLGDAYEYLMRNFATESGKSKGQFYTPAEVSRIMAQVIGIKRARELDQPTVYDPTCGSGSLLIKAADEAATPNLAIYGQEKDVATWALARMNMILHAHPTAEIWRDNTISAPHFKNKDGSLKTFDFAVANPPFSDKAWSNGLDPSNDEFKRFEYGVPPAKNGDYAFLLHFIKSLKSTGKGAIIMPHGVLFRGNREADIRRNLIKRGYIKGIIGLPANLFYGTGIPACILIIDKENAHDRTGIFMIDASKGFIKDGNKNRLREQDIRKIVDVFNDQLELPRYSRMVPISEVEENDYNLNIPRYIDSSEPEDLHDLDAHLNGGIPNHDIKALEEYWQVFPTLYDALFTDSSRAGYSEARIKMQQVKPTILAHSEFKAYEKRITETFNDWSSNHKPRLEGLSEMTKPKELIRTLSDDLLARFAEAPLIEPYDVYQRLMEYWAEVMHDDIYLIVMDGWLAGRTLRPAYEKETPDFSIKKGQKTLKYVGDLVPAGLLIARFFTDRQAEVNRLEGEVVQAIERREAFEEEHGGDEGALVGLEGKGGRITKANVQARAEELKEVIFNTYPEGAVEHKMAKSIKKTTFGEAEWRKGIKDEEGLFEELDVLFDYLQLLANETTIKKEHKQALDSLLKTVIDKFPKLTEDEIKTLVVENKWFTSLRAAVEGEVQRLAQQLTTRVKELDERYAQPLPELERDVEVFGAKVEGHLKEIGLVWG